MTGLPSCRCGRPGVAFRPGSEPEIAPGGIVVKRGQPASAVCLACWPASQKPRVLECWQCAGTSDEGVQFSRTRKPRGRPLLCVECAAEPAAAVPVFVRATYRRHEIARATSPQLDIENAVRGKE